MYRDRADIISQIKANKVIAILRNVHLDKIEKTVEALYKGGIRCLEITFCQESDTCVEDTVQSIRIANSLFEDLLVGAGTVITEEQLLCASDAGVEFIISPTVNLELITLATEKKLLAIPGALTPTEILQAYNAGAGFVKVFPANNLGPKYIKAISSPLGHIPLMAVGGINLTNILDYYKVGCCSFGIGGNLVNMTMINKGDFEGLTYLAQQYVKIVKEI